MTQHVPDLVIVGAPKAATTTLTHWLRQHPQVACRFKETSYFDQHYHRGRDWYLSRMPEDPGDRVVLEATPSYLSEPGVAERVARDLPNARFVAVLREPSARAWSNYWFFRQYGLERRPWSQALDESVDAADGQDLTGYVWRGMYGRQLARWDAAVGRDRLHVLLFDDLVADPQAAYDGVCAFAGIARSVLPESHAVNPTRKPRSARLQVLLSSPEAGRLRRRLFAWNAQGGPVPTLCPADRVLLADRFAADAVLLQERLGHPLPAAWQGVTAPPQTPAQTRRRASSGTDHPTAGV